MNWNVDTFRLITEGYVLVLVGLLGIFGNIALIFLFSRKKKNFHRLMLVLAMYDILYILMSLVIFGIPNIFQSLESSGLYKQCVPVLLPLAQIGMTGSIYLTAAVSIERYFTVCHPYYTFARSWSSLLYILPIVIFSVTYNAPKFFELEAVVVLGNSTTTTTINNTLIQPTHLRTDPLYIKIYLIYLNLVVHGVIPFILLIGVNIHIYRKIEEMQQVGERHSLKKKEIFLTNISIGIVVVFILCHAVKWIPNIWELLTSVDDEILTEWPSWLSYITCLSHLLTTLNSSVNFYIYSLKQKKFRRRSIYHQRVETTQTKLVRKKLTFQNVTNGDKV